MFRQYREIENHYREEFIKKFVDRYPDLKTCEYIITEKIHGANFQINMSEKRMRFGSRKRILDTTESFFDYRDIFKDIDTRLIIKDLYRYKKEKNIGLIAYGELYGKGLQKGVEYPAGRHLRIFDIYDTTNNKWISPLMVHYIVYSTVPVFKFVKGLDAALEYAEKNVEHAPSVLSPFNNSENNNVEGFVIRPFEKNYFLDNDWFVIKYKSEKFKERVHSKKNKKEIADNIKRLQDECKQYINENRTNSVLSKIGKVSIKYMKDIMNEYRDDVKKDFEKDNKEFNELSDKDKKLVLKVVGKLASKEILKRIK